MQRNRSVFHIKQNKVKFAASNLIPRVALNSSLIKNAPILISMQEKTFNTIYKNDKIDNSVYPDDDINMYFSVFFGKLKKCK